MRSSAAVRLALAHTVVLGAVLVLGSAAGAASKREPGSIRATHEARRLMARADWDYSGKITAADSAFASAGRVTWAQTLIRAARRLGIGGGDGLDDAEVRRFVLRHAGGDRLLDYMEQFALTRTLGREYGDQGPQEPRRHPRKTLAPDDGARMLRYRGDTNHDGLVTSADDPDAEYGAQKSFAGGLLRYAGRHGIGDGKLGDAELAKVIRRFTGPDGRLSPAERARLDRTIRPA